MEAALQRKGGVMRFGRVLLAAVAAGSVCASAAMASAASSYVLRPAGKHVSVSVTAKTSFVVNAKFDGQKASMRCKVFASTGVTPHAGLVLKIKPPKFSACTDSLGGKDTITTNSEHGSWKLSFAAPRAGKIAARLGIPEKGARLVSTFDPYCVIVAAPKGPTSPRGTYNNAGKLTFKRADFAAAPTTKRECLLTDASLTGSLTLKPNVTVVKD